MSMGFNNGGQGGAARGGTRGAAPFAGSTAWMEFLRRSLAAQAQSQQAQQAAQATRSGGMGFTEYDGGPGYASPASIPASPAASPDVFLGESYPGSGTVAPGGTAPSGGGTGPGGMDPNLAVERGADYWWSNPEAGINNMFQTAFGGTPNVNNAFYNALLDQAPGLKFMHLFTEGQNNPKEYVDTFMNQGLGNWFSGNGGFGGWDTLASAGNTLFGGQGNNIAMQEYINTLDPRQALQMLGSMVNTSAYGHMGPELVAGLTNAMAQAYSDFSGQYPSIMDTTGLQSEMGTFTDWARQNAGDLFNFLGF